eukprot:2757673-Ditylum_brightwellii.AAC.1
MTSLVVSANNGEKKVVACRSWEENLADLMVYRYKVGSFEISDDSHPLKRWMEEQHEAFDTFVNGTGCGSAIVGQRLHQLLAVGFPFVEPAKEDEVADESKVDGAVEGDEQD